MPDTNEIRRQAEAEVAQERFRTEVEKVKTQIRQRRTFLQRVFPWRIRITHI